QTIQDNREKTSAEEVVDSEDNESNDGIDCQINDEIDVGSDAEDNEDNNHMNEDLNIKTNELNDNSSDNQCSHGLNTTYNTRKRKYTSMESNDSESEEYRPDLSDNEMDDNCGDEGMSGKRLRRAPDGKYLCHYKGCEKSYTDRTTLRRHRSTHLSDEMKASMGYKRRSNGQFVCLINTCNAVFNAKLVLRSHQMSHLKEPLKCPQTDCPFAAHTRAAFQRHAKTHIKREKCLPIDCPNDVNEELNVESIDSQIVSEINSKTYDKHKSTESEDNGSDLSDYEMDDKWMCWIEPSKTNGKFVCDYRGCDRAFPETTHLKRHAFSHLSAKTKTSMVYKKRTDGWCVCLMNACNAVYKDVRSLRGHQMSHLKAPLKCPPIDSTTELNKDLNGESIDSQIECEINTKTNGKRKPKSLQSEGNGEEPEECSTRLNDNEMDDKCDDQWIGWKPTRNEDKKYVCDYRGCGRTAITPFALRMHAFNHLNATLKKSLAFKTRSDGIYVCLWGECIKTYKTIGDIRAHVMSHLKDPLKWSQTCCRNELDEELNDESIDSQRGSELNTETNDKRKQESKGNGEPEECGSGLSDNEMDDKSCDEWMGEKELRQASNGKYLCDYRGCGLSFTVPSYLRRHAFSHLNANEKKSMAFKKRSDRRYVCLMGACNETFKDIRTLRGHQMSHLREPLKCPQTDCLFAAVTRAALTQHLKTHPKPYPCNTCGQHFATTQRLAVHKTIHNDADKFRCDWPDCGRLFTQKHHLRDHMNTHTGAVQHACQWPGCANTYTNSNSLKAHVNRVHKGLAEYRCHWPECDYQTTNRIRLNNHIHRQHEETDFQLFGQTSDESMDEVLTQREDNTRHETQDNREKTSAEEVVASEDNESNDGIDCHINIDETDGGSVAEENHMNEDSNNKTKEINEEMNCVSSDETIIGSDGEDYTRDETQSESESDLKPKLNKKCSIDVKRKHKSNKTKDIVNNIKTNKNRSKDNKTGLKTDTDPKRRNQRWKAYRNVDHKRNYICHHKDCRYDYESLIDLKKHYRSSKHLDHRWFCEYDGCSQHFPSERKLEEHTNDGEHTSGQPFTCWHYGCDFESKTRDVFDIHTNTHSPEELIRTIKQTNTERQFGCEHIGCGKRFVDRHQLNDHSILHSGARYRCEVDGCSYTSSHPTYIKQHMRRSHKTNHRCPHEGCDFSTGTNYLLSLHVKSRHSAHKQLQCLSCPKRYTKPRDLKAHHLRAHPDSAPTVPWLECPQPDCDYKTKYKPDMAAHEDTIHTMSTTCAECGKSFTSKSRLQTHSKSHNPELKTPCEWPGCDRKFNSAAAMRLHMQTQHADTTPAHRCQWPGCDKAYSHPTSLLMHERRVHEGVLDHRCHWPGCDYQTTNRIRLNNHINSQHKVMTQREDNTRHETQVNREKTSAEEVVDSEDNESNDGIDCDINDETDVGSDAEDNEDNNHMNKDLNKTNELNVNSSDSHESNDGIYCDINIGFNNEIEVGSDAQDIQENTGLNTDFNMRTNGDENETRDEIQSEYKNRKTGLKSDTDKRPKKDHQNSQYKRNYICHHKDCRYDYISLIDLKKHYRRSKHLDHRWFCKTDGCSQHFPSEIKLIAHTYAGEHTSGQPFTCWHYGCDFESITRDVFDIHTDTHSPEVLIQAMKQSAEPQFVCEHNGCGKRFTDKTILNSHMITHSGLRFRCEEANCSATFTHPSSLRKHTHRIHRSDFQCPREGCNFSAGSKCELSDHVKRRHTEAARKQFQCSATGCPKRFTERRALNAHHLREHPDAAPTVPWLECPQPDCDYRTKYAPDMAGHEAAFHTMSNACAECGKSFANKSRLQTHLKTHNEELKTPCEWPGCDRKFNSASAMRNHIEAQHSDSGPAYRCQWPGCDKTYSLQISLAMHERRVHKGVAEHRCHWPGCDYQTTNRVRLHSHINGHKGLKAYQCSHPGCDYESKREDNTRHETQDNREKTSAEEMVDSENNESNDETDVGSDAEDNEDMSINDKNSDSDTDFKPKLSKKWSKGVKRELHSDKRSNNCAKKTKTIGSTDSETRVKTNTDPQPTNRWRNPQYKRYYICHHKDCRNDYISLPDLRKHYRKSKHLDHRWFCDTKGCSQHFPSERKLDEHKTAGQHTPQLPFTCWHYGCDYECKTRYAFDAHTSGHSPEELIRALKRLPIERQFVCQHIGCGKSFAEKSVLKVHMISHSGAKYRCEDTGCSAVFSHPSQLHHHVAVAHRTDYRCRHEGCRFAAGTRSLLNNHERTQHTEGKPYVCSVGDCPKRYATQRLLDVHQRRFHPEAVPDVQWLDCPHPRCQYRTKHRHDMTQHEATDHTMAHKCDECGKCFTHTARLRGHMKTHNPELKVACEWPGCDRRFFTETIMKVHMEGQHSDASPAYRCQWPGCDKSYSLPLSLTMHERRVHKGMDKQRCHWPACDYQTTNRIRLYNHINKHKGLNAFQCSHPGCDYRSKKCIEMDNHIKSHSKL
ncbi:unnamed protein product, partial [Medioppia subpectinata]